MLYCEWSKQSRGLFFTPIVSLYWPLYPATPARANPVAFGKFFPAQAFAKITDPLFIEIHNLHKVTSFSEALRSKKAA